MRDNTVKYSMELVDKFGEPLERLENGIDNTTRKIAGMRPTLNDQSMSLKQLRDRMERYRKAKENSFRTDHIRRYNQMIQSTEQRIRSLERTTRSASSSTSSLGSTVAKLGGMYVGAKLGQGIRSIGADSIKASAQVEQYGITLQNMLGSKDAADARIQEYLKIAAKTPFEMNEVVEAGNQLQALGRYSKDNLTMLGDLAASSGKPMEQAMDAYAKLVTGQKGEAMKMFRNLLISAEDWQAATGKGVSKNGELLASTTELVAALPGILQKKGFMGMMAAQVKSTTGRISNMKDAAYQLNMAMGDRMKPAYDKFLTGSTRSIEAMKRWVEIPVSRKLEDERKLVNSLASELSRASTPMERRNEIYAELQRIAPKVVAGIDAENVSTSKLLGNLREYNRSMVYKIMLKAKEEEIAKKMRIAEKQYESVSSRSRAVEIIVKDKAAALEKKGKTSEASILRAKLFSGEDFGVIASEMADIFESWGVHLESRDIGNNNTVLVNHADQLRRLSKEINNYAGKGDAMSKLAADLQADADKFASRYVKTPDDPAGTGSTTTTGTGDGDGTGITAADVATQQDAITGRGVKQVTINLDSLINTNNNYFDRDTDPAHAEDFMGKLRAALVTVLNDVNEMV